MVLAVEVKTSPVEGLEVIPLTVTKYHQMLRAGIFEEGEPVELLHGLLVAKERGGQMVVSPRHRQAVHRFLELASRLAAAGGHLQLQSPVTIEPSHEPEPDAMLVRGSGNDYAARHPSPADVSCVIEVAESSLPRDRGPKLRIYAAAGIPQYVIVDLNRDLVELHERPDPQGQRYRQVETLGPGDELPLLLPNGERLKMAVAACLP